jgi:hypothetical protein
MTGGSAEAPRCPGVVGPHSWAAEVVVDEALARRPLRQFRELDLRSLRLLATGWDRTVWLVNEAGAFGFPRREIVVPGIERELVWLPHLAPLLPLPIPEPRFVGEPTGEFPWPFFGAAFVPGVEAWKAPLNDTARLAVALELACSSWRVRASRPQRPGLEPVQHVRRPAPDRSSPRPCRRGARARRSSLSASCATRWPTSPGRSKRSSRARTAAARTDLPAPAPTRAPAARRRRPLRCSRPPDPPKRADRRDCAGARL